MSFKKLIFTQEKIIILATTTSLVSYECVSRYMHPSASRYLSPHSVSFFSKEKKKKKKKKKQIDRKLHSIY